MLGNKARVRCSAARADRGVRLLVAGCLLLAGTAGCGSSVSDKPASVESRAGNGKAQDRTGALQSPARKSGQNDPPPPAATGSAGATPSPTAIPRDVDDRLNIPEVVAKGLGSQDARDRYRALEYWEEKDSKAPMDPVFDLVEDSDPAVRAKAASIIEKYLESGQERE